ncbi:MAG: arylamine N-acetyltransferase [Vicinamibacterales bacterium]
MLVMEEERALAPALAARVCGRLGLSRPRARDLAGLRALYAAWCRHVPFDNLRKMIALAEGAAMPGGDAAEFFEAWLEDGAGGTCWPTSGAFHALARQLGFDAVRIVGHMRDLGIANHGSVAVTLGGVQWLTDTSMLTNAPLPLGTGVHVHDDPVFAAEVEPDGASWVAWCEMPPNSKALPCRLFPEPVGREVFLAGYAASAGRSPFNQRLYVRRNRPGEMLVIVGHTRFVRTPWGLSVRELSAGELLDTLRDDAGYSAALVDRWARAGGLDRSFAPADGPPPPPVAGVPPSRR